MGIKLKDRDSIIFLYYFFVIKMVQAHAKREEGIKLSPVGLLFLSMRGFQAHQRLNVIFEPILCCSWGSKIRRKVIAIRKTYNDLRVGSNPSGCLHGGRNNPKRRNGVYFGLHENIPVRGRLKRLRHWLWHHNVLWLSDKNSFSTQEPEHPLHTIPHFFLTNNLSP